MGNRNRNRITDLVAPAAAILGGLVLLFRPVTVTALVASVLGWGVLILGGVLAIAAFGGRQGLGAVLRAVGCVAVGLWLTRNPVSSMAAFGKFLGILLILSAVGGFAKSRSSAGRAIYGAEGVVGLVLLVAPFAASRLVYTVCGLALIAGGIGMLGSRLRSRPRRDDIIDV